MATFYYTQKKLGDINQSLKAIAGAIYIQSTGVGKGASYKGQLDGTLKWISDNFTENTTEVVNGIVIPAAMSAVDDTNVTLTLGGTPLTSLLQSVSLTLGWTGVLDYTRGGTGLSTLGTAGQILAVNAGATALEYVSTSSLGYISNVGVTGDTLYWSGVNTPVNLPIGTNQYVLTSVNGLPSWQPASTGGYLVYYFQNTASDIATYYKQISTPYTPSTALTAITGVTNGQTLYNFSTDAGYPNKTYLPSGVYNTNIHCRTTVGTKAIAVYAEIWEVSATGVDIGLIATTGTSIPLTAIVADLYVTYSLASPYTMSSVNSRINTRIVAVVTGGGSAPNFILSVGGATDSRTEIPSNIVDATNFVPYTRETADMSWTHNVVTTGTGTFGTSTTTPIIYGNTTASGTLTLNSTSHATKGKILFGTSAYDEVNNRLGIGTSTPYHRLQVYGDIKLGITDIGILSFGNDTTSDTYIGVFRGASSGAKTAGNWLSLAGYDGINFCSSAAILGSQTVTGKIFASGNWTVGGTTDNGFKLQVTGVSSFSSNTSIGTYVAGQRMLSIAEGTAYVSIGSYTANTTEAGLYMNQATPDGSNYSLRGTSSTTYLNGSSDLRLLVNGILYGRFNQGQILFTPQSAGGGALTNFTVTMPANTNQTLSTEIPSFKIVGGSHQWATGAIVTQRENYISTTTYTAVGASTITSAYGLYVEKPTASTNVTITNNYSLGLDGNAVITQDGSSAGLTVQYGTNPQIRTSNAGGTITKIQSVGTVGLIGTETNKSLEFCTNNVTNAKLFTTGNWTIGGTTDNGYKLEVTGTAKVSSTINNTSLTASTILSADASQNIVSLATATYPSLTELSYVKGLTSAIQEQLGTLIYLTAGDVTTTSNVAGDITGLVYAANTVSKRYYFEGVIHTGCNNFGGIKFQITVPTGATLSFMVFGSGNPNTSNGTVSTIAASSTLTTQVFNAANSALGEILIKGEVLLDGTHTGNIQFGFASGTNTQTSTVYQLGTVIKVIKYPF